MLKPLFVQALDFLSTLRYYPLSMPGNAAQGTAINLLPEEQIQQEPVFKFLRWVLTTGRYIVIFTEAAVLVVFLARFKLDSDIIDLKQEITAKAQVLQQAESFEEEFLSTRARLQEVSDLVVGLEPRAPLSATIETTIPKDVTLTEFSQSSEQVKISGETANYSGVTQWVKLLSEKKGWSEVKLESIQRSSEEEGEGSGLIQFGITASLEQKTENE